MASQAVMRAEWVRGPDGRRLTLDDLPAPGTMRWVPRRKAEILAAINGGLIDREAACRRWQLTHGELDAWQDSLDRAGVPGLRVTRIQVYRGYDQRQVQPRV